jgi:hypothetical protein|tara:strand:+ start:2839 stop:2994 length:156 start_codon:yes stop_codon:yes gene_type:complete
MTDENKQEPRRAFSCMYTKATAKLEKEVEQELEAEDKSLGELLDGESEEQE